MSTIHLGPPDPEIHADDCAQRVHSAAECTCHVCEIDWQARNDAARARWITEHGAEEQCPNCGQAPIANHPESACVLNVLITMIREGREDADNYDEYATLERHRRCHVDKMWDSVYELYDDLSRGRWDIPE